ELAIVYENLRAALDDGLQRFEAVGDHSNSEIQGDERGGGDESSDERIITGVHGILDGVGKNQQEDQIERGELADWALAGEPKKHKQKAVDHNAANDKFPPGNSHIPHD